MFVKKFEADSIEDALKAVKSELGPDAIILKTITNNGLKGAFKKKKIEITAAITEKNYQKKAQVDKVFNSEQKEIFYQKPAAKIKESINKYSASNEKTASYGNLGLNKVVNTLNKGSAGIAEVSNKTTNLIKNSLDDFLSFDSDDHDEGYVNDSVIENRRTEVKVQRGKYSEPPQMSQQEKKTQRNQVEEQYTAESKKENITLVEKKNVPYEVYTELKQEMKTQQHKIDLLEKKILELSQNTGLVARPLSDVNGYQQLRTTLKTLDLDESIIQDILKKASFELNKEELENSDALFEFALKELTDLINTETTLFSKLSPKTPVVTVLISDSCNGQTSIAKKLTILNQNSILVSFTNNNEKNNSLDVSSKFFDIQYEVASNFSEVISYSRKAIESGKSVIIDLKIDTRFIDETKKFIETFKRGFSHVEFLGCISAIHSELHNKRMVSKYRDHFNGLIITNLDLCLNFGAIVNLHKSFNKIPLKYFGTGPSIPDDIEEATAERLMAGLFQF